MLNTNNAIEELSLDDLSKVSGGGYYESPSNGGFNDCPSGRLADFNALGEPCAWNCDGTACL